MLAPRATFTYSRSSFWTNVSVALLLTGLVSVLSWLVLNFAGARYADAIALTTAFVFFAFCSILFIARYARRETVLAIQPQGFLDIRFQPEAVPWDDVRKIALTPFDSEYRLDVLLWDGRRVTSELAPLDASPQIVLAALQRNVPDASKIEVRGH